MQPTFADQQWLDAVIAAGMPVVDAAGVLHDGTSEAERDAAQARVEAGHTALQVIISIHPIHAEHEIKVTCADGSEETLAVILRWGKEDDAEWYTSQIKRLQIDLSVCEDMGDMKDMTAKIREYKRDYLRLYIPDLPSNLLTRLEPNQYEIIRTVIRRIELDGDAAAWEAQKKMLEPYEHLFKPRNVS